MTLGGAGGGMNRACTSDTYITANTATCVNLVNLVAAPCSTASIDGGTDTKPTYILTTTT